MEGIPSVILDELLLKLEKKEILHDESIELIKSYADKIVDVIEYHHKREMEHYIPKCAVDLMIMNFQDKLAAEKEKHRWHKWPEEKPENDTDILVYNEIKYPDDTGETITVREYSAVFVSETDSLWMSLCDTLDEFCWQPIIGPQGV